MINKLKNNLWFFKINFIQPDVAHAVLFPQKCKNV